MVPWPARARFRHAQTVTFAIFRSGVSVSDWRIVHKSFHGSVRRALRIFGAVAIVKDAPLTEASSFHVTGIETVAPGRARVKKATMLVAPRWLRRQSRKILPLRSPLLSPE